VIGQKLNSTPVGTQVTSGRTIKSMEKVAVVVDVQNIYYTTKEFHNCDFNYNAFWAKATSNSEVVKAIAYAIDKGDEKQKQFQNILRGCGFKVKLKPFIERSDGSAKGDWDVGITLDVIEYAKKSDVVVLASGDGDFDLLENKIRKDFDVSIEVYGVSQFTAVSLINSASKFVSIEDDLLLKTTRQS
jgi:uncharacterized LabA/DUF88 family protein